MEKLKFSKLLDYLIKESSYSIKQLSDETGINRTVLQKYISGNRFPSSYSNIELITEKLTLSNEQHNMLYNAYKMEKIGYDKYERLQLIKQVIENIKYPKDTTDYHFNISYQFGDINSFAKNKDELILLIRFIINQAKNSNSRKIMTVLPRDEAIYEILYNNLKSDRSLSLEMLIYISNDRNNKINNIKQFQSLLPIIFLENSQIKYQYFELSETKKNTFSFPYLIATDNNSLLINDSLSAGILLNDDASTYILEQFASIYRKSKFFCSNIKSITDIVSYYTHTLDYKDSSNLSKIYSFSYEPCIVPNLDRFIIQNKFSGPKEYAQYVEDFLVTYKNNELMHIKNNKQFVFYCTKSGLKSFYETGRVSEIPNQFYKPFSKSEVIQILNRIIILSKSYSNYRFYLIKEDKFNIPDKCSLVLNDNEVLFTLGSKNNDSSVNIALLEPTIKNEFSSLIDLIELEECYYDYEYSLKYFENFIKSVG